MTLSKHLKYHLGFPDCCGYVCTALRKYDEQIT